MTDPIQRAIDRTLGAIRRPFRAVLTAINVLSAIQLVQADAMAGEQLQDNELMQHYGFTSAPPAGTQMVVLPVGGKTAHGIIIATEHGTYRFKLLAQGEVALYSDEGDRVHMKRGRVMEIVTNTLVIKASVKVRMESPLVEQIGGELRVDNDIVDRVAHPDSDTMRGMRTIYNTHHHPENDSGGPTGVPNEQM